MLNGVAGGLGFEQHERCHDHDHDSHHEDSHGLIDRGFRNGTAKNLGFVAAEQAVESEQEDHGGRCCLDTATAATRVCTDQHDNHKEEQRAHAQTGHIYGVQAGGTAGECHEGAGFQLLAEVQALEGVAPFAEHKEENAHENDNQGKACGNVGMERYLADSALFKVEQVADFGNGQEAEAAGEREHAGGNVHERVQLEPFK